jgi:arginase family enzyme
VASHVCLIAVERAAVQRVHRTAPFGDSVSASAAVNKRARGDRAPATEAGARDVGRAIDELAGLVDEVYVHVDLDALDPEVAPGIVDAPVPGGLSLSDLEDAA